MSDFPYIPPTSVVTLSGTNKAAAFTTNTSEVFKEDHNIFPVFISDKMQYIPWGADNQMPYNIIDLIESDETLATCQMFNAEVCYGSSLVYNTDQATAQVHKEVDDFLADNDIPTYFGSPDKVRGMANQKHQRYLTDCHLSLLPLPYVTSDRHKHV